MTTVPATVSMQVPAPAREGEAAAIISMIERVARDPAVDITRLERLLELRERVVDREARMAYIEAFVVMQPKLPSIDEKGAILNKDRKVQSTYAKWSDVVEAITPILGEHGFKLNFRTTQTDTRIVVTGVLSHRGGHSEETQISLPYDTSGSKNAVQSIGSSQTYGQRYTAKALLNLTSRNDPTDDDGQSASPLAPRTTTRFPADPPHDPVTGEITDTGLISQDDLAKLIGFADNIGADKIKLCRFLEIESLAALPASRLEEAKTALANYRAKKEAEAEEAKRKAQGRRT